MRGVEESLLQLRDLIAKARKQGDGGDERISVQELERRLAGLKAKLFREHRQQQEQEQEHDLHLVSRRRHQQHATMWTGTSGFFEGSEAAGVSLDPSGFSGSLTLNADSPHAVEEEKKEAVIAGFTRWASHRQAEKMDDDDDDDDDGDDGDDGDGTSNCSRSTCGASYVADPGVHLLVDITDGSTQLESSSGMCSRHVGKAEVPYSSSGNGGRSVTTTPLYSFAQSYANDDRQRLFFIIDQLSHILREERMRKEMLLQRVVPVMVQHIEKLERDVAAQRREIAFLKRSLASAHVVQSASGKG